MKKYSVRLRAYKYGRFQWEQEHSFLAKDKNDAKRIAGELESSTEFSMDITPIADLRTIRETAV
jgi:hypothetical protein